MLDTEKITVYKDGKAISIDKKSLAVFVKYGYSQKPDTSAEKKTK